MSKDLSKKYSPVVQASDMRSKPFLISLLLSTLLSFIAPLMLIGFLVVCLALAAYLPGMASISQMITAQILKFLTVFGTGNAISGAVVIALACSLVGALFDTYSYYYRSLRNG